MIESNRMIQPGSPPKDAEIVAWIGGQAFEYWKEIISLIDQKYPGVFIPEWIYGGKKHGWSIRYKKNKSFCTLIPEKGRFAICDGCLSSGARLNGYCNTYEVRKCAIAKSIDNCSACGEQPCEKLNKFHEFSP